MISQLIVMLTYNDETVKNAAEIFAGVKDLPITHWGFKDVGLSSDEMKALVQQMKAAGKTTYLEVVSLSEAEGLRGAHLAVDAGFDVLMGTVFFDSINQFLKDKPIKYYPFPGHVFDHPSILDGTIENTVNHAKFLECQGVQGLDLLAYRYTGDAPRLLKEVVQSVKIPLVCAGSVATFERIAEVFDSGAWGFTIGSAFFDQKFVPQGDFRENLFAVSEWMKQQEKILS
jgi:hypothetical protein